MVEAPLGLGQIGQPATKPAVRSLPGAGRSGRRRRPRQEP